MDENNDNNPTSSANTKNKSINGTIHKPYDNLNDLCHIVNEIEGSETTVDSINKNSTVTLPVQSETINTPLIDNDDPASKFISLPKDDQNMVDSEEKEAKDSLGKKTIGAHKDQITKIIMENKTRTLSTGFPSFDTALLGGLRNETIVIGGIPSVGKSTLSLQMASHNAEDGCIVIYVSLEMSEDILVAKNIARELEQEKRKAGKKPESPSISACDMLYGKQFSVGHTDKEEIRSTLDQFYNKVGDNLIILDRKNSVLDSADDIRDQIKRIEKLVKKAYGNDKPVIVYIDYLQIIPSKSNTTNDKVSVDCNMATFQAMANELEIPVVIISSLGKTSYNKPISIDSYKGSGSIEYSADTLIGLQYQGVREKGFDIEDAKKMNPRKVELVILKQRTGSSGQTVKLDYYPEADLFVDPTESKTDDSIDDFFDDSIF